MGEVVEFARLVELDEAGAVQRHHLQVVEVVVQDPIFVFAFGQYFLMSS